MQLWGMDVDLVYASLPFTYIPPSLDLMDDSILVEADLKSIRRLVIIINIVLKSRPSQCASGAHWTASYFSPLHFSIIRDEPVPVVPYQKHPFFFHFFFFFRNRTCNLPVTYTF